MISITLTLPVRRFMLRRHASFLRVLVSRRPAEWVEVPATLKHPPSARAQRLMREARSGN